MKTFRDVVDEAVNELRKPSRKPGDDPNATKRVDVADIIYNHFTTLLREDFCTALVKGETLEQFIERIKVREGWDLEGPIMY